MTIRELMQRWGVELDEGKAEELGDMLDALARLIRGAVEEVKPPLESALTEALRRWKEYAETEEGKALIFAMRRWSEIEGKKQRS